MAIWASASCGARCRRGQLLEPVGQAAAGIRCDRIGRMMAFGVVVAGPRKIICVNKAS